MTKTKKALYEDTEALRNEIKRLAGKKYRLDCGHHVTLCHFLGNNIIIYNGKDPKIICSECGY